MTLLGVLALAALLVAAARRSSTLLAVVVGASAALPASAGVAVGPVALPLFTTTVTLASVAAALGRFPLRSAPRSRSLAWLVAFAAWSLAVTAVGPWAFEGLTVIDPARSIDDQVGAPSVLTWRLTNLSQAVHLVTGIAAVLLLRRTGGARRAVLVAAWVATVASTVRELLRALGLDVLAPVLETLPIAYSDADDPRWRGVFVEPSEFATFACGVAALGVALVARSWSAPHARGRGSAWLLTALALLGLAASGSGTAAVAGSALVALGLVVATVRVLVTGGKGAPWYLLACLIAGSLALLAGGDLVAPVLSVVDQKVGSQSLDTRSVADEIGRALAVETHGLGAGLGSTRASSFLVTLVSATGAPGTALFAIAIASLLIGTRATPGARPFAWCLVALLVAKTVSTPDLSTPQLWLVIAACLPTGHDDPVVREPAGRALTATDAPAAA